jgi:hypothetical protein
MSAIAQSFNDKSETKAVIANGVKVNGVKYMTIEASDDSLKAKKVRFSHPAAKRNTPLINNRARKALSLSRLPKPSSSLTTPTPSRHPTPTTRSSS